MKRVLGMLLLLSFILPALLIACSGEMDEDDYVRNLRDKRHRDQSLMYVQEHRVKKAVPELLYLIGKRYGTLKAIYTLGIIGDPVAVPPLIEELKVVAKKDSLDHDRMTEQICTSLGMIGEANAVDSLLWVIDNGGEMGNAGAIQALGMIGDPRGAEKLVEVLKDEKRKLLLRHYAAIALGRIKDNGSADALVYALFVDDKTGLNLFRDGQLSLIQIGGEAARNALIKGFELKNEDAMAWAKSIELKPEWVQIKTINTMGELRDPGLADFLMGEYEKGKREVHVYELFAKIMQSLERIPLKAEQLEVIAKDFMRKPSGTAYLNEKEILSKILISNAYSGDLDALMKVAEAGDITLKNLKNKPEKYAQWCVAAANVISLVSDHTMSDRFDSFVKNSKCKAELFGMKVKTADILNNFNERMKASKQCGSDMACWQKTATTGSWQAREKALYVLANTNDKKYMPDVMKTLTYPKEEVRYMVMRAIDKISTPEFLPRLIRFWHTEKINKEYQKITESIGYIIHIKLREWNLDGSRERSKIFEEAEKLEKAANGSHGAAAH